MDYVEERQHQVLALALMCFGACVALATSVLLGGCAEAPTTRPAVTAARPVLSNLEHEAARLIGAEAFMVTVEVEVRGGEYVKAYGVKTPYEETVHPLKRALPMAIRDGRMYFTQVQFQKVPVTGAYPFEFWVIDEHGRPSNRLASRVVVQ